MKKQAIVREGSPKPCPRCGGVDKRILDAYYDYKDTVIYCDSCMDTAFEKSMAAPANCEKETMKSVLAEKVFAEDGSTPAGSLLSATEVAQEVGVTVARAYGLMKEGKVEYKREGRKWLAYPNSVKEYADARRAKKAARNK